MSLASPELEIQTLDTAKKSLHGYMRLTCSRDAEGRSYLSRKEFRSPIHLSKPYWDGRNLLLNVMSPTAGLFAGDLIDVEVKVEPKASLILSSPSSLRAHKMDTGFAAWNQSFHVSQGAFLETNPEWLIMQGESDFRQNTEINLDPGAELFFIETLAPGRAAYGENFEFRRFKNRFHLYYDGQPAAIERYEIDRSKGAHRPWQAAFESPFYASLFCVSEKLQDNEDLWIRIHKSQTDDLRIGSSALAKGPCWNIKLLSNDPIAARKTIAEIRELFYQSVGRGSTKLRR
ncbi:MAG: urease accessory protein UreD [Verrucomicrobiota bacterium]